jgi:hypothetical protein
VITEGEQATQAFRAIGSPNILKRLTLVHTTIPIGLFRKRYGPVYW